MKSKWRPILWGVAAGALVGVGGLLLAVKTSCGLCTHVTFTQVFFPYALIADPPLSHYALDAALAGVQWPLYGAAVGSALSFLPKRKALLAISILAAAHALGVAEANRRVNAHWEFKRISGVRGVTQPQSNNGVHQTPLHGVSHARWVGARAMPGVIWISPDRQTTER